MKRIHILSLASLAVLAAGCASAPDAAPVAAAEEAPVASIDPRVKFRDGERFARDLSEALNLPRDSVCKELSQYDCVGDAFRIVLGGVEPETLGVDQPLEKAALTAPIALDRVALSACSTRVAKDLAEPASAVLLRPGALKGGKKQPDKAWMKATAAGVYDRVLRREATAEEVSRLVGFYSEVSADRTGPAADSVKDWVALSCFAVATSLEGAFY